MSNQISFIHAADLHLDSPFQGLATVPKSIFPFIRQSTFHAFDKLVKTAIEKNVDFVLLVGDLFDNEKQSLKAQVHLRSGFEKLQKHQINVYLSYGNHDYEKGNVHPITYPENVFIFEGEAVSSFIYKKNGQSVARIYGFSYENRAVFENKTKEYKITDEHIPFHIGMLHGSLYGNQAHDPYAPFQLNELKQKSFDYWALGHIHKREILSKWPPIVYSGNTQGRHRNESGEKGCYVVTLTKEQIDLEFVPLHSIMFDTLLVDISHCETIHDIEPLIRKAVTQRECAQLLHLTLTGTALKIHEWEEMNLIEEVIDLVNESSIHKRPWTYIYRYTVHIPETVDFKENDFFISEFFRTIEDLSIRSVVKDLYTHRQAKKYLSDFTDDEQQEIKDRAKQLIVNELLQGRE